MAEHGDKILDQFTKQASLFQSSHRSAEAAIAHAITVSGVGAGDTVLDLACGPGVLSCAFAKIARWVTGIDITPKMLEQAKALQSASGIANVTWELGDVNDLPFENDQFSMIVTRYGFHHLERPDAVLAEMIRVCEPNGRVVVIDSAPAPKKAAMFNRTERLRDPSHTQALTAAEISALMDAQGLKITRQHLYAWEVTAESLVNRSFPVDLARDELFRVYAADVGNDAIGMNARYVGGTLYVTFPTLITVARK